MRNNITTTTVTIVIVPFIVEVHNQSQVHVGTIIDRMATFFFLLLMMGLRVNI